MLQDVVLWITGRPCDLADRRAREAYRHARALEQRKILPPVAHDAARVMARANLRSRSRARARRRRLGRVL